MKLSLTLVVFSFYLVNVSGAESQKRPSMGQQINNGFKTGSLTESERDELKSELQELRDFKETANKDGNLSDEEKKKLQEMRKELQGEIRDERNDAQMNKAKMFESLDRRLDRGVEDGSLTKEEAEQLRQALSQAQNFQTRSINSDGKIDPEEHRELSELLNEANKRMYQERNDLQGKIANPNGTLSCGDLSPEECQKFRERHSN